ncbi:MAG: MATE family efflux transporter [Bacteroidetes bacterium]|nr:MATE family efflux transporter [Bacteroidota bacterium]HET6243999.1 MATE family efflux transporter [Bacteroidia bacterium]
MREDYLIQFKKTWKLAYPICLSHLGHVLVGVADSIMVGNYGGEGSPIGAISLAAASLANGIFSVVLVFGIGVSFAISTLVASADGENNKSKIMELLKHSILICTILGLLLFLILFLGSPALNYFGQTPAVVELAIPYFSILGFSMLPLMVFMAFKNFAEGLSFTRQAMYISIISNLLNVFLNYLLIYGKMGFPEMGLNGAGWATFISRVLMAVAMFVYIYKSPLFSPYKKGFSISNYSFEIIRKITRLGIPIGLQFTFEVGAFAFAAIMIGWIGAIQLASHQIAITLASVTYMLASGISAATTVRVGNQFGAGSLSGVRMAGFSGFILSFAFMFTAACIFIVFSNYLPPLFNQHEKVIQLASSLIVIAALFQLSDGVQVVGLGALRGMSDVKVPTFITVIAYWGLALPLSYFLGFTLNFGARGIWVGLLIGLSVAAVLLFSRFNTKSKAI